MTPVDQLASLFLEEATEHVAALEAGLLVLAEKQNDTDAVQEAFRAAHSLKGGAATFGFSELAWLVHQLEALLDRMRSHRAAATPPRIALLLQCVDVIRTSLDARREGRPADTSLIERTAAALASDTDGAPAPSTPTTSSPSSAAAPAQGTLNDDARPSTFAIRFAPHRSFFLSGNDPGLPLQELRRLGPTQVRAIVDDVPTLAAIDPEASYLAWDITVETTARKKDVLAVFDWVTDIADLSCEERAPATGPTSIRVTDTTAAPVAPSPAPLAMEDHATARRGGELSSVRVTTNKLDALVDMVGELVITQALLAGLDPAHADPERYRDALALLERNTRQIQEAVMRLRMQPVAAIFSRLPRIVHDLAARLGKDVRLTITGDQTEIDRTMLERIADPLTHLVRNALDHGLESPEERVAAGKGPRGHLEIHAAHQGGQVLIEVRDDGRGVNHERVLDKARRQGLIPEGARLSEDEILDLLFQPGFSTAQQVSDISGRGVGLDVVRQNIRALGGTVTLRTARGRGTHFSIRLPLTVSIIDAQLIGVAGETFIVPLLSVVETIQLDRRLLGSIPGHRPIYRLRGSPLPVIRLRDELGLQDAPPAIRELLMVVEADGQRVGFVVDDILGQQQVVLKSLEDNYARLPGFAGASILGTGSIALILDIGAYVGDRGHRVVDSPQAAPRKETAA